MKRKGVCFWRSVEGPCCCCSAYGHGVASLCFANTHPSHRGTAHIHPSVLARMAKNRFLSRLLVGIVRRGRRVFPGPFPHMRAVQYAVVMSGASESKEGQEPEKFRFGGASCRSKKRAETKKTALINFASAFSSSLVPTFFFSCSVLLHR